jgi:adenosylmethionine-8-amino-7-oxononanoate aminotransferase
MAADFASARGQVDEVSRMGRSALPEGAYSVDSAVFYRNVRSQLETIVRGEGVYLFDSQGRRYLDAVGGTSVVSIGHGVKEIYEAVGRHAAEITYAYNATFTTRWQEELARAILSVAPPGLSKVYFMCSGSEANETAVKMARQYHLHRGRSSKHKVIARWQGFHGVTIGTLSLSGRPSWRQPFDPYLLAVPHISPPYCYRCPFGKTYPDCGVACAEELERSILHEGADTVSAFIAEPVIGTSVTGVVPVPEYYKKIREICDRHDVLFIADEVLCGYGRTGYPFAITAWGVTPDIVTIGKAISSGYAPLSAAVAAEPVVDAFIRSPSGEFTHGSTYSGNALSCFVGLQVHDYMRRHSLFDRPGQIGAYLHERLEGLAAKHGIIGDTRGRGLLAGVEFVADRRTGEPFPAEARVTERIVAGARERGVMIIPGIKNANYGKGGDHIQITPPYVITEAEIDTIVDVLDDTIREVAHTL